MIFLDSNILIYASGFNGVQDTRTGQARAIVRASQAYAVSVQVLGEFHDRTTRPRRGMPPLTREEALRFGATWRTFKVVAATLDLFDRAIGIQARFGFRYWDCAVIAAAQVAGCHTLYSEDMQHDQIVDEVRIVNPFRTDPALGTTL